MASEDKWKINDAEDEEEEEELTEAVCGLSFLSVPFNAYLFRHTNPLKMQFCLQLGSARQCLSGPCQWTRPKETLIRRP